MLPLLEGSEHFLLMTMDVAHNVMHAYYLAVTPSGIIIVMINEVTIQQ